MDFSYLFRLRLCMKRVPITTRISEVDFVFDQLMIVSHFYSSGVSHIEVRALGD